MKEVPFYEQLAGGRVRCGICPHRCLISQGEKGICRVRENRDGTLYAINYGLCAAWALDPMEKKPLYHFYPGSAILSLGSIGCNFRCSFCQNWEIAQTDASTFELTPREAIELAREGGRDCVGIAYTYSEPLMWYEWVLETAQAAGKVGLKNVLVTNGYINPEPRARLLKVVDAFNIDVKAFGEEFYRELCGGRLEPVRETVSACVAAGKHVELTTLLIPGWNDSPEEVARLVEWVASLDWEIPLHLSRYFPRHKLNLPPTPVETLYRAQELAREKLAHVYLGNLVPGRGSNTYCSHCGHMVIRREGFQAEGVGLREGKCTSCGVKVPIVF